MRYYQPFPAAIPLYEAGYPRVTHPSATNSEEQALHRPFDLHVLSTPPAFILSQDQTLVKSVCSVQESLLAILSLYCVWFVWTVLRNFLFKEIFKGCCLLFSYQGSCRSFLATALIFYQISSALSRTFLFFCFAHLLSSRSASSDSLYRLSHLQGVVNSFFHLFFQRFRLLFSRSPVPGCSASASPADMISCGFSRPRHQRQMLSYHRRK